MRYLDSLDHILFITVRLLKERKRQTLVLVMGVTVGVAAFVVMSSLMFGFQKHFIRQVIDLDAHISIKPKYEYDEERILRQVFGGDKIIVVLGSKPKDTGDFIRDHTRVIDTVSGMEGVLGAAPHLRSNGIVRFGPREEPVNLFGIDPSKEAHATSINRFLEFGSVEELDQNRRGIILGRLVARDLGVDRVGRKVVLVIPEGGSQVLEVIDFFDSGITTIDSTRAYVHIRTLQSLTGRLNEVNEVVVKVADVDDAVAIARRIEKVTGYDAVSWQEAYSNFLKLFKIQKIITYLVTGAILVVSSFGIFNILMMTVLEKKREIAILRAMGYTSRDLTLVFLMQGLLIGVVGAVAGSLAGFLIQEYLASVEIDLEGLLRARGFILDRSPLYYICASLFALILSVFASLYPARRASYLDPVEIFRSGGF